ncbi:MAG: alpha/beta hydrolase [Pseudonocardia sp.]|nr:alpha/beta hydrolase [Pseudonocardia sp.]
MPYRDLPADFEQRYESIWVTPPNTELCDPRKVAQYYQWNLDELELADPEGPLAAMLTVPADDPQAKFEAAMRMASILHFIWPIPDKGLDRRIHRVRAETLLLWGEQDRFVDPAYADTFAARVSGSRVVTVPSAGHMPQLENAPVALAAVGAFLNPEKS